VKESLQNRAFERIAASSEPGETPIMATRAVVGSLKSGRLGALASGSGGLIGGAIAGALQGALSVSGPHYVVLTNRRLVFVTQTAFLGRPGKKIAGSVPVGQFSLNEYKPGGMPVVRIAFGQEGQGVSLTFGAIFKKEARALVDALGGAPVA
jgi:hypothetical protein